MTRRARVRPGTDRLTGLPDRSALLTALRDAVPVGDLHGGGLLVLGLDRFAVVNESLGHAVGDDVLVETGRRLSLHAGGRLVARVGDDEFALLLPPAHQGELLSTIASALAAVRAPRGDRGLVVTASAGLTWVTGSSTDPAAVLEQAQLALHASKARGRDRLSAFDEQLRVAAHARLTTEREVRAALDQGRLRVHLQPLFSLEQRAVVGAEALLRVLQPDGAERLAVDFVDVADELGLLPEIDAFVLRTVGTWLAERALGGGPALLHEPQFRRLSVNACARSLRTRVFADALDDVATRLPASGPHLAVELTESVLLELDARVTALLSRLRASRIELGLDDFGTGYSSLAQLQDLPLDFLKLDRAFVGALDASHRPRAIVRAVVELAQALDLDVIAEGVETEAQRQVLGELGCRTGQGWLFAAAAPAVGLAVVPVPRAGASLRARA